VDPTTKRAQCTQWADCLWNQYCSPADYSATPMITATCKDGAIRSNPFCTTAPTFSNPTGECGWTQFCVEANQDEAGAGHTPFTSTTCHSPYSIGEGEMCPPDINLGSLSVGTYTQKYPLSFCASGPSQNDGSNNVWRCAKADWTYAGTGCRASSECGRGLTCGCPQAGGGRQRCILDNQYQNWEKGRTEWFDKLKPWYSCLEDNHCALNTNKVGSCGKNHCADHDLTKLPHSCSTSLINIDPEQNVPNYQGYAATINAGSHALPSLFIILLVNIILALI